MEYILNGIKEAFVIIISCNKDFLKIVSISIFVTTISTILASFFGIICGVFIAQTKFLFKNVVITIFSTLMSLPTVLVGLVLYAFFSHKGFLGSYGLLFTRSAMIIGQIVLIFPIIVGLTISCIKNLDKRIWETIISLGANKIQSFLLFLKEARYGFFAAIIAGFSRGFSEVGVSMMLGGNIKDYTRNITTAIALETSKGNFALGIALGFVLLFVALLINILFSFLQKKIR